MTGPQISVEPDGDDVAVVEIGGEHDIASAPRLRSAIEGALAEGRSVVLDLSPATFVDSTVLGVLIGTRDRAAAAGAGYALVLDDGAAIGVRRILEITGLRGLLPVLDGRAEALDAVRADVAA